MTCINFVLISVDGIYITVTIFKITSTKKYIIFPLAVLSLHILSVVSQIVHSLF